jgi:hypothetical protein
VDYNRTVIGVYDSEEEAYTAYTAKLEELGDNSDFFFKIFLSEFDVYKRFYDDLLSFAVCIFSEKWNKFFAFTADITDYVI